MPPNEQDEHGAGVSDTAKAAESDRRDPRDTDHPAGSKQAAENAANESPS
jgi:hypothetical protein